MRLKITILFIILLVTVCCAPKIQAQNAPTSNPNLPSVLKKIKSLKAGKLNEHKRAKVQDLTGEACQMGDAESCLDRGTKAYVPDTLYPESERIKDLQRACDLDQSEACTAAATYLLRYTAAPAVGAKLLDTNCKQDYAKACATLAKEQKAGVYIDYDWRAAINNFQQACDLGLQQHCADVESLQTEGPLSQEQQTITKTRAQILKLPAEKNIDSYNPQVNKLLQKIQQSAPAKKYSLYKKACELGNAGSCMDAFDYGASAAERDYQYLERACELSTYYCEGAAKRMLRLANHKNKALEILKYACEQRYHPASCLFLADFYREEYQPYWFKDWRLSSNPFKTDNNLTMQYYQKHCYIHKAKSVNAKCEKLDEFHASVRPETIVAKQALAVRASMKLRALPLGAYQQCADHESEKFGQWLDQNKRATKEQLEQGFFEFVQKCGGSYARPQLTEYCAQTKQRPAHHNLVCEAVINQIESPNQKRDYFKDAWTLNETQLAADFTSYDSLGSVKAFAKDGHLGEAATHLLAGIPNSLASGSSQYSDQNIFYNFDQQHLIITVNQSGHAFTYTNFLEFLPEVGLTYLLDTAKDPNLTKPSDRDLIDSTTAFRESSKHLAFWDDKQKRWLAQTQLTFNIKPEQALRLLRDTNAYFSINLNKKELFFLIDRNLLQRWVLATLIFPGHQQLPSQSLTQHMHNGYLKSFKDSQHACGEYNSAWTGSKNDTFARAYERINQQSRWLNCRNNYLVNMQKQRQTLKNNAGQDSSDYWYQLLLDKQIQSEANNLNYWQEGIESFKRVIASEETQADNQERREQRLQRERDRQIAEDARNNKRDEYYQYLNQQSAEQDRVNAMRVAQGLPPLPSYQSSGNSSAPKSKTNSSKSTSTNTTKQTASTSNSGSNNSGNNKASGNGSSNASLELKNTSLEAEHQRLEKIRENQESRARLQIWIDEQKNQCQQDNQQIGSQCNVSSISVGNEFFDQERQKLNDSLEREVARNRENSNKNPDSRGACPSLHRGTKPYYHAPACNTQSDGENTAMICLTRATWQCNPVEPSSGVER